MSTHTLDTQLPERLLKKIADMEKKIRELRTLQLQGQNALQFNTSSTVSSSTTISIAGDMASFRMTLESVSGARIFGIPCMSLYGNSVADGNLLGVGGIQDPNWEATYRVDERNTTDSRLVAFATARDRGPTGTIHFRGFWIYLIEDGTTEVLNSGDVNWNGGIIGP